MILLINSISCIMIQQITKGTGIKSYNQMSADQGNSVTLAVIRNNKTVLLSLGNRYQYITETN